MVLVPLWDLPEGSEETTKYFSQGSLSTGRDSIPYPRKRSKTPAYKVAMFVYNRSKVSYR
jgi:hypothetical protein